MVPPPPQELRSGQRIRVMADELKDCFDGAEPDGGVVAVFSLLQVEGWWRCVIFRGRRSTVPGRAVPQVGLPDAGASFLTGGPGA